MTNDQRNPAPSVRHVLYSYPTPTLVVLGVVVVLSAVAFVLLPGLNAFDIGIATLAQVAFALAAKLLWLLEARRHHNRGLAVGDGRHMGAIALLFVVGFLLIIGPALKINAAYHGEPHPSFCP
jgi:hypothetical protein